MIKALYLKNFPTVIINDQYYLREQRVSDASDFLEYYSDTDVNQYILATAPKTLLDAQQEITYCINLFYKHMGVYWTLARRSDDKMIGSVGFYINNYHHRAELCYELHKDFWRQGIMKDTLKTAVAWAWDALPAHRIEAVTLAENAASIGILKGLGFEKEGSLKNYRCFQNRFYDIEMLAITPDMWEKA